MDQAFIDILKKLVNEQGKDAVIKPSRLKSLLADYTQNEYKRESRWLMQAVELGVAKAISEADELALCKKAKLRDLQEEGLSNEIAASVVDTLMIVLREEDYKKEIKNVDKQLDKAISLYDAKRYAEAMPLFDELASSGNAASQYYLSECYYHKKDYVKSFEWGLKAAEQEHALAQNSVGYCYDNGEGVSKDQVKAVEWYRKAAEQGLAKAQDNLGFNYQHGIGVSKDYAKAFELYKKAADQEYDNAYNNLGYCYQYGIGVKQDYAKAVEWYRKAAEKGKRQAQYNLGMCYSAGMGVPQDYSKAAEWLRKARDQGGNDATNALLDLTRKGKI